MALAESDELTHQPTDDWLWRESLYFSFHDVGGEIGGMTTIGIRPNQKRYEGLAVVFLHDHEVLFYHAEGELGAATRAGISSLPGITLTLLAPFHGWHVRSSASFVSLDPFRVVQEGALPHTAIPAGFDLTFEDTGPAYEFPAEPMGQLGVAAHHYQQNGRFRGQISIGERLIALDGFGFRDHSWGIRDLSKMDAVVAVFAQFGTAFTANVAQTARGGTEVSFGYISRNGTNIPIRSARLTVEPDPLGQMPRRIWAEISPVGEQQLTLEGETRSIMPILFHQQGDSFHWFECSTRFRLGQETACGITEVTRFSRGNAE